VAANSDGGRAQPAVEKIDMKRQGGGRKCPLGCAVVPAGIMPRGFFATLPINGKEGKQTQPVSFVEKAGSCPAQAPMPPHMAQFAAECKGRHVAMQQIGGESCACARLPA
jgi:hypothetical protein